MMRADLPRSLGEAIKSFVVAGLRGIQAVVTVDGRTVVEVVAGHCAQDEEAITAETRFRAFSASKALTGCCVHLLVDRGEVDYDAPVTRYIPGFGQRGKDRITIRQLLSHQAGLIDETVSALTPADFVDWDAGIAKVSAMRPKFEPGTGAEYDGFSAWAIAAEIVRRVDGREFVEFCNDEIIGPVGMAHTTWTWSPEATRTLDGPEVASFSPGVSVLVRALDEPPARDALIPGGGAFSTARDLARFYNALLGLLPDRPPLLSAPTLAEATRVQAPTLPDGTGGFGLGFFVGIDHQSPGANSGYLPSTAFGHPGLSTVHAHADPATGSVAVFLTNTAGPRNKKRLKELTRLVVEGMAPHGPQPGS